MPKKKTSRKKPSAKKAATKSTVRRTVKIAAENVQSNADRARDLSAALIRAGELLGQGAAFLDSIAERATEATSPKPRRRLNK